MNRIAVGAAGGVGFLAAGLVLLTNGSNKGDLSFMLSGAGLIIMGFIFWLYALRNAGKEDKINSQSRQALIDEVKGLRQDFGNEVKGLRQDFGNEVKGLRQDLRNRDKRVKARPRKGSKSNGDN